MPPVQLHLDDPVAPQHPQGVTPQTAAADPASAAAPANNQATTTSAAAPAYPSAQPGQAAVPAPTSYAPPTSQPAPTRTSQFSQDGSPPPPQPGAVPAPSSSIPPPPKAGESPAATATAKPQGTPFTGALNQMHIPPPPQTNLAPTHSTTVPAPGAGFASPSGGGGPTTLNLGPVTTAPTSAAQDGSGRRSSEHPPGYQQNVYAQEMTPAQRASLEGEQRREGFAAQLGGAFGGNAGPRDGGLGGGMMGGNAGGGVGGDGEGVWGAAKSWLGAAGSKLAETEEEVWRRINGK